jgi:hypothetical protein
MDAATFSMGIVKQQAHGVRCDLCPHDPPTIKELADGRKQVVLRADIEYKPGSIYITYWDLIVTFNERSNNWQLESIKREVL